MLTIENELPDDTESETLEVRIDGRPTGNLSVDRRKDAARVEIGLGPGFHHYELQGHAVMRDGTRRPISGSGAIAFHRQLWRPFRAAPSLAEACQVFASAPGVEIAVHAVSADDFAEAEQRLGVVLPRVYREEVTRGGAFDVRRHGERLVALYHPREIVSSWDWLVAYHEYTPTEPELQVLRNDIVFADVSGPLVFFYAPEKRCPDGEPSFESGFLDHDEMCSTRTDGWDMYVYPHPDHCDWEWFMKMSLYQELTEQFSDESASVSKSGWIVYRTFEQNKPGELTMYLSGPFGVKPVW